MIGGGDSAGKKKIGWLCSYVPEELIMAAGLEPVRLMGTVEKIREADTYISPNLCPYLKCILDSGLRSRFEGVEGVVFTNSCDGMRRLYDVWRNYVGVPPAFMLEVPKNRDDNAIRYFTDALNGLKKVLEETCGARVTGDELDRAISLMNDRRGMVMELFEKQKGVPTPGKGSELFGLCLDEVTSPKGETTERIKGFAWPPGTYGSTEDGAPRILIMGNVVDKQDIFKMVESAGASVVVFDTCVGLRHYSVPVERGSDPVESLARRYLLKPACARMPGYDERVQRVERLIDDYSVHGIIYSSMTCCDYGLFDAPVIEKSLQGRRPAFLTLENDYLWGDEGRIRTRVEAFVEMIRDEYN